MLINIINEKYHLLSDVEEKRQHTNIKSIEMKRISILLSVFTLIMTACKKESDDCHFFITIRNNSENEIIFAYSGFPSDSSLCTLHDNITIIKSKENHKYRPYQHPDCIEQRIKLEGSSRFLFIVDPNNYTTDAVPCEEFEERNTILRTYALTLEDLERLDYTINYPEDASIEVK